MEGKSNQSPASSDDEDNLSVSEGIEEDFDKKTAAPERVEMLGKVDSLANNYNTMKRRPLVIMMSILTIILVTIINVYIYKENELQDEALLQFIAGVIINICCLGVLVIAWIEFIYIRALPIITIIVWIASLAASMISFSTSLFDMTALTFILILSMYIVLPVTIYWSTLSIITVLIQAGLVYHTLDDRKYQHGLAISLTVESLALCAVNWMGLYIKYTKDRFIKDLFKGVYNHVSARIELEEERQRQEQLLLSMIPPDLAHQMRHSMVQRLNEEDVLNDALANRRLWHDFYVREHKEVTVLFADLVNFTQLTTKCNAKDLVTMLNEIYGKFDNLSRMNDCMRIKTLGDCYCCVSGMPVSRPNHAVSVVKTGLLMVKTIKSVRESTGSRLDMRIGVHSGDVLCGVLGLVKWKYDIWSEDVAYANFLESTGVPGKIHISRATYLQCSDDFMVDPVEPPVLNSVGEKQETYLVRHINVQSTERRTSFQRSRSINSNSSTQQLYTFLQSWGAPRPFENLASSAATDSAIPKRSYEMMEASVDSSFFTHSGQHCMQMCDSFSSYLLTNFTLQPKGKQNRQKLDEEYKKLRHLSVLPLTILTTGYFIIVATSLLVLFSGGWEAIAAAMTGVFYPAFIIYFSVERRRIKPKKRSQLGYHLLMMYTFTVYGAFVVLHHMAIIRIKDGSPFSEHANQDHNHTYLETYSLAHNVPEYFAFDRLIDLMMILPVFFFLYTNYLIKMLLSLIVLSTILLFDILRELEVEYLPSGPDNSHYVRSLPSAVIGPIMCVLLLIMMSIAARQYEAVVKSCLLWKMQFNVENEEVEVMKNLTKLLLSNILPQHVATYYLDLTNGGTPGGLDLYHESYDNVCIMFAAVMNFDDFFRLSSDNDMQHQCLRLLNEIIGDFDQLLTKPKFSSIEKMKTVGSTYMAASGLQPGRAAQRQNNNKNNSAEQFVHTMTEFALSLFTVLDNINKHSFNNFRLRIGVSHGPVIAGVVGAQKPQYDVWGDTVNMASRMESGGIVDRIQMTENTGELLLGLNFPCVCRGKTAVKGKSHLVTTYLLQPNATSLSTINLRDQLSVMDGLNIAVPTSPTSDIDITDISPSSYRNSLSPPSPGTISHSSGISSAEHSDEAETQ